MMLSEISQLQDRCRRIPQKEASKAARRIDAEQKVAPGAGARVGELLCHACEVPLPHGE